MIYIGIDPGRSGAIALISSNGRNVEVAPFDPTVYIKALKHVSDVGKAVGVQNCKCCLEHVSSMPRQGVASTFNFGENFGWIQGILDAFGISYELVRPQKWKKEFSVTGDKNTSIAVCKRLFPDVSLLPSERCRKDHDGMAEALLMAEYARRRL